VSKCAELNAIAGAKGPQRKYVGHLAGPALTALQEAQADGKVAWLEDDVDGARHNEWMGYALVWVDRR
jgi:hypothetical protein